jgi:glycosyltransferase involved in cell wall biosynthesis
MSTQDKQATPVVSVAMLGARMHFAVPSILADAGLLHTLYTDTYLGNKAWLRSAIDRVPKRLTPKALAKLSGRAAARIPPDRVVSFDRLGLHYYWNRSRALTAAELNRLFAEVNREFGLSVIRAGLNGSKCIWGFNGAALEIFAHARERGITCILEQTMAPRKLELQLLHEENGRWPDWQTQIPLEATDPIVERETAEWKLADKIICGSEFVFQGLLEEGVAVERVAVVPYGVDLSVFKTVEPHRTRKLNLLFLGEVGLRKGVPYLLEALRLLDCPGRIHARMVGNVSLKQERLKRYSKFCEFVNPVSRQQVIEFYRWADVLVLPSLCEGSATVIYEALACGVPVITTANAGSLVRNGVEGFIVPIRDAEQLASRIETLCDEVQLRLQMSAAAIHKRNEISLAAYARRLLTELSLPEES